MNAESPNVSMRPVETCATIDKFKPKIHIHGIRQLGIETPAFSKETDENTGGPLTILQTKVCFISHVFQ